VTGFAGIRATQDEGAAKKYGLKWIRGVLKPGISLDPSLIHFGKNSGFQALNLAVLLGATRVLLLGFDMGGTHFFGAHPPGLRNTPPEHFAIFIRAFAEAAEALRRAGVDVINCTPGSALDCFERQTLNQALR